MSLDPTVASLVDARRLGGDGARRRFTVARREAVMKLRAAVPSEGFGWILWVIRAARRMPGPWNLTWEVISQRGREQLVVAIEPATDAASSGRSDAADGELELAGLLSAGLSADARVETPADVRALDRAAAALGAALNAILASGPRTVTIEAGAARRRWHRDDAGARDRGGDPYDERREDLDGAGEDGGIDNLSVRITVTYDQSLGRWLGRILGIRRGRFEGLDAFAYGRTVRSLGDEGPLHPEEVTALVRREGASRAGRIELGSGDSWRPSMTIVIPGFGWFVPAEGEATWLLRDGVRVLDLAPALRGIGVKAPGGMLEVDALSLTALGDDLVLDEACHAVAAWLDELARGVQLETGDDGQARVRPSERATFSTVGELGAPIRIASLEKTSRRLGELRFAWPHEIGRGGAGGGRRLSSHASGRPLGIDLRTLCLTPSEVALLSRRLAGTPVLHHAVVGRARRGGGGLDVERLARGSVAPLVLLEVASLRERAAALAGLGLRMAAYVPRKDGPFSGQHVVTFFGREVARVRLRPERPGIVVHTELLARTEHPPGMAELERHPGVLRWADRRARELLIAHNDDLLGLALAERNALKIPLVKRALRDVDARTLRLSYVADEIAGARLSFRETPLLRFVLSGDGDDVITVRDTVEALREGVEGPRMARARADAPRSLARLWSLTALGDAPSGWTEPTPNPGGLLSTSEMRDALERSPRDGAARQRLRAHLLESLAAHGRDDGLSTVALFDVYDPVAREPWSRTTLNDLRQRSLPWVHPAAATRALRRPALPLRPREARSLSRVLEVPGPDAVGVAFSAPTRGGVDVSRSRDVGAARVTSRIEHALARGELWIDPTPGGGGVELWHDGLRIEVLRMSGALGGLSGHLALRTRTPPASSGIATLRALLGGEGSALVETLGRRRALATPGGPERAGLDAAWARIRGDVSATDAPGLRARLLVSPLPEDPDPDLRLRLDAMVTRLLDHPPGVWIMRLIDKGLGMRAKPSRFSSRSVRVEVPARAGTPLTLRVGLRHRWNRRVLGRGMRRGEPGPTAWEYLVASVIIALDSTAVPSMLSRLGTRGRRRWLAALVESAAALERATGASRRGS